MKPSYFADLLQRYLHHDTTEGEAWTVDQWYEARDMPRPATPTPAEQAATKARMWQQVQARTRPRPTRWPAPAWRWAAAALVLALGAGWLVPAWRRPPPATAHAAKRRPALETQTANGWLTSINHTNRPVALALADGSTVTLSGSSSLRHPQKFDGPERVVTLRGEAFFAVFHDAAHPFRVLTDKLETTVLGTSFTVWAFPGAADAAVLVRTGRVRVGPRPNAHNPAAVPVPALVLHPNQQAVYSPADRELRRTLVDRPVLLQPAALVFDERPVAEVLGSLQAGYGVPIRYDGAALANCTVSLAFTTETLFEKLDLLCKTLDASYERTDDAIVFRSRGCQGE